MRLAQVFAIKEEAIKQALVVQFSDSETDIARITKGFEQGADEWKALLSVWVGKDKAESIMEEIRDLEVSSATTRDTSKH